MHSVSGGRRRGRPCGSLSVVTRRPLLAALTAVLAASALSACATGSFSSAPTPSPTSSTGTLGAGFYDPSAPPAPEGTVAPKPGSWDDATPPAGYTVVLLSYVSATPAASGESTASAEADAAATKTMTAAVTSWAAENDVTVTPVVATKPAELLTAVASAIDKRPDLVIAVGNALVDPLAAITPGALHQRFLVLGAELAEPTSNVTAAEWNGAGFRGEGLGPSSHYDPATFTPERTGRALRAGVAAVVNDLTGIVVWVD